MTLHGYTNSFIYYVGHDQWQKCYGNASEILLLIIMKSLQPEVKD